MTKSLKIAIAQLNLIVGDIDGILTQIQDSKEKALKDGVDLIVFSELTICGYPPEDLVLRPRFQRKIKESINEIVESTTGQDIGLIIGTPWFENKEIYNSAILIEDGKIISVQHKHDLPNYGVFDEKRVFKSGGMPSAIKYKNVNIGIMICEDMWNMKVTDALSNADIILSMNASPFEIGKYDMRRKRACDNVRRIKKPLIYVNQICGQDDLFFDGDSFAINDKCENMVSLSRVDEDYRVIVLEDSESGLIIKNEYNSEEIEQNKLSDNHIIYQAMVISLRDYVNKNNFSGVVIGMSGGIDSALSAAIAVDAIGADRVRLVMMPSKYTSQESLDDAKECAENLAVEIENISIENLVSQYDSALESTFDGCENDLTEENLQSRIRGTLLMAISNKFGHMVLSTGNKSEMAVGYATLYGDMCGGYNVLKDLYKMQVFEVSKWRNQNIPLGSLCNNKNIIPENIISKPPTAELREDQKDEDSLPPYEILDKILYSLIEERKSVNKIIAAGFDEEIVNKTRRLVYLAEYKRRQSAPGVKISKVPFSRDRRYPITNKYC